ncbi:hypothetical protein CT0861_00033 [Colletotrichum tofieldiae]|uniref:Uncharacterized protein n=1 Tax=Colletotrichum tofieldiae TaxID=708197 RepID=A0A166VHT8_9PEZI|nr:hypothetical protein CT0861_00033 [Colletotrichum tofieldiae]
MLATTSAIPSRKVISYEALGANRIPGCDGKNKKNCNPGGGKPANPYTRGCSAIDRCRTDGIRGRDVVVEVRATEEEEHMSRAVVEM